MRPYYEDSAVTLYHGDCREVLPQLEPVEHVITDPPYEAEAHTQARRVKRGFEVGTARTKHEMRVEVLPFPAITEEERHFVATEIGRLAQRWALVFCQAEAAGAWEDSLVLAGLARKRWCVWVKPDGQPQFSGDRPGVGYETIVACHAPGRSRWNGGGKVGVFTHIKNDGKGQAPHPTTKPEPLMSELVTLFTDQGETILDPFGGSGTTAVAAKRLGRRCVLIEREEKYCEVAAKRLQQSALDLWTPPEPKAVNGDLLVTEADLSSHDAA